MHKKTNETRKQTHADTCSQQTNKQAGTSRQTVSIHWYLYAYVSAYLPVYLPICLITCVCVGLLVAGCLSGCLSGCACFVCLLVYFVCLLACVCLLVWFYYTFNATFWFHMGCLTGKFTVDGRTNESVSTFTTQSKGSCMLCLLMSAAKKQRNGPKKRTDKRRDACQIAQTVVLPSCVGVAIPFPVGLEEIATDLSRRISHVLLEDDWPIFLLHYITLAWPPMRMKLSA